MRRGSRDPHGGAPAARDLARCTSPHRGACAPSCRSPRSPPVPAGPPGDEEASLDEGGPRLTHRRVVSRWSLAFAALALSSAGRAQRSARAPSSGSTPSPPSSQRARRWRWTPTATSSSPGRAPARTAPASASTPSASTPRVCAQGGEFQVNTYTTGNQSYPAVAMDADGDFVVAWTEPGQDGSGYGVFARRFTARGRRPGRRVPGQHLHHRAPAVPVGGDGRRRRLRRRLAELRPGRHRLRHLRPAVSTPRASLRRRVPGQHLHRRATSRTRRWRWTPTATSSSPGRATARTAPASASTPGASRARASRSAREFQVNTYTTSDQRHPVGGDGRRRRLRRRLDEHGQDGSTTASTPSVQRRGRRPGGEFRVNTFTTSDPVAYPRWRWTPTATSSSPGRATARTAPATASSPSGSTPPASPSDGEFQVNTYTTGNQASRRWRWTPTATSSSPGSSVSQDGAATASSRQRFAAPRSSTSTATVDRRVDRRLPARNRSASAVRRW